MGPVDAPARLGSSDTCVLLSPSGHSVSGDLSEGGHTSRSLSWGGGETVPSRPRFPLLCPLWDRALAFLLGTPEAGVSQADSLQEVHTFICKGETEVKLGFLLAGDSGALSLRYWAACASWQGQVILFLSAFQSLPVC